MYPSRWRKAIKKPSLARVFKTRAHVGYNLIKAVLLYSRVYLKFARLVWRRIFRPFERINEPSQDRSLDDSFEWWDEERGIFHQDSIGKKHSIRSVDFIFLAASPPPVEGTMPFSLARGRSNLDFQMKASPTIYFLCSALVKFEGREGEREKKEELGHRTDIPTEPQTLTKVFRTEEQSPLCLCPLSLEHCAPGY